MFTIQPSTLRRVLWLDAGTGFGMAASHLLGAGPIAQWTGLPEALVALAGALSLLAACFMAWVASRPQLPQPGVRAIVLGNFVWVAASAWLAWGAGLPLTTVGTAWVLLQGLAVLVLAELEWAGLRAPALRPAV
ncbi:hypothetical protein [Acidovorax lacteus]|uniref:Uncharacterized protein n=1 Tax=Acidovorax lacteus TaxID=1924988 RepID=A0ABP8KZX2_9BURK